MKNNIALNLEVEQIESRAKPGCSTSSTSHRCTCPAFAPDTER